MVDLLRPIGDLVAIPQPSKPHKAFLSVLVRCYNHAKIPFEVSLSFDMRKFTILITDNKLQFPSFHRDLEKFVYSSATLAVDVKDRVAPTHGLLMICLIRLRVKELWIHRWRRRSMVRDVTLSRGLSNVEQLGKMFKVVQLGRIIIIDKLRSILIKNGGRACMGR